MEICRLDTVQPRATAHPAPSRGPLSMLLAIALALVLGALAATPARAEGADSDSDSADAEALQMLAASGRKAAKVELNGNNGAVITTDGALFMWGDNRVGQLGDGTATSSQVPQRVPGLSDVVDVSLGELHCGAVTADGSLYMWGYNETGQIGDGTTTDRHTPQRIEGIGQVSRVLLHGSRFNSAALTSDGSLYLWGSNVFGQLGNGTTNDSSTPQRVPGLPRVVAAGVAHARAAAVGEDGGLYVWGETWGGIGDGTKTENPYTPQRVPGLSDVVDLALTETSTAAITRDGGLWTFGLNYSGELGTGSLGNGVEDYAPVMQPHRVQGIPAVRAVVIDTSNMGAIATDGSLWTWGDNDFGQRGDGTTNGTYVPLRVPTISGLTSLSSAHFRMAATTEDGGVYTWGDGYHDRFSEPNYVVPADKLSPVRLELPPADDEALVTFDTNGRGVAPDPIIVKKGSELPVVDNPLAIGYTFAGWYQDRACTQLWNYQEGVNGDVTVYAGWVRTVVPAGTREVYRLYNPWSHEHLYTNDASEGNALVTQGWTYEGVGWNAPETSAKPIYRLYNPWSHEHLYTMDRNEYQSLDADGWDGEGVKLYSADETGQPAWRVHNPWEDGPSAHLYTTDANERATLLENGCEDEGVCWYGLQ